MNKGTPLPVQLCPLKLIKQSQLIDSKEMRPVIDLMRQSRPHPHRSQSMMHHRMHIQRITIAQLQVNLYAFGC